MNINLSISPAPGIATNYLVAACYKASAPTTLVQSIPIPAPHTSAVDISFTGLDSDTYYVKIYENTTSTPGGTIRHQFIYQPTYQTATLRMPLVLTVDNSASDPVGGTTAYTRADLAGFTYFVERRGAGTMIEGMDLSITNNGQTITLLAPGDQFGHSEIFILRFEPQIVTSVQIPGSSIALISNTIVLSADTVLDSTALGNVYLLQGSGPTLSITLPDKLAVGQNKPLWFISEGGSHINAAIKAVTGQFIGFLGQDKAAVYLGQSEQFGVYMFNGKWRIFQPYGDFSKVGEIVHQYQLPPNVLNALFANGATISRTQYPRLTEYVLNLPASELVDDTTWGQLDVASGKYFNKGKFSTGDGSTTIRLPLLYDPGFLRGVDGAARTAGSYQLEDVHLTYNDTRGNDGTNPTGIGYGGGNPATFQFRTTPNTVGTETRPASKGIYLLVRC